jgi:predicted ATPase
LRLRGFAETEAQAASKAAHYHRVFLLERLPWTPDYARTENAVQAERLDNLLEATYREHGYTVIRIPVGSVDERAAEILAAL